MSAHRSGFARHLWARLRNVASDPGAWLALGFTSIASVAFWPGLTGPDDPGWLRQLNLHGGADPLDTVIGALWLLLWPVLATTAAAGRVVHGLRLGSSLLALPALPVTTRGRMLAETTLVLGIVGSIRVALLSIGGGWEGGLAVTSTLAGVVLALPVVLAWTAPAVDESWRWARPTAAVTVLALLARVGVLASWPGLAAAAAILAGAVLVTAKLALAPSARGRARDAGPASHVRQAGPPPSVLRHDLWAEPATRLGLWVITLVAALLVLLVADRVPGVPPEVFFVGSLLAVAQIAALAMRPFGSSLLGHALKGRGGSRPSDLAQAFAVLPLRREAVLRAVWTHAFAVTAMAWILGVGVVAIRTYLRHGSLGLLDAEGQSVARILLPAAALIPAVAGFVTAAVSGRKRSFVGSGLALLGMLQLPLASLIVGRHLFGPGSPATPVLAVSVLVALCLAASLLPLPQLLGRRT